jgi:two-component system sensor histidine kinase DesK
VTTAAEGATVSGEQAGRSTLDERVDAWRIGEDVRNRQVLHRRLRYAVPFAGLWLLLLIQPATDAFDRATAPWQGLLAVVLLLAFSATYLTLVVIVWDQRRSGLGRALLVLLVVLAVAVLPLTGASGLTTFIFVAVIVQVMFPWRIAVLVAAGLVVLSVVISMLAGWSDVYGFAFPIAAASLAMFGVARMTERNRALIDAQHDREQYAVLAERERFARDLHDILGHSLTVITVKSELAGRLVDRDPERARAEIADVERLARQALADVRATVGNYRQVSLAAEIASARSALLAAGIEPDLPTAVDDVPEQAAETFGYVVREGITNVVRHSGATRCWVRVGPDCVEVVDDGRGAAAVRDGHGLQGLRARVEELGGRLEAGPRDDGSGFRLAARVGGTA